MKGDPKLIKSLNSLLADELTAINQYMVHSEMCDNWGYPLRGIRRTAVRGPIRAVSCPAGLTNLSGEARQRRSAAARACGKPSA